MLACRAPQFHRDRLQQSAGDLDLLVDVAAAPRAHHASRLVGVARVRALCARVLRTVAGRAGFLPVLAVIAIDHHHLATSSLEALLVKELNQEHRAGVL